MNKFLSKVVATSLLSTITIVSLHAKTFDDRITPNKPVWGTSTVQTGGELLGANVDLNVTLGANSASDTHFTLNFVNGSIADTGAYSLCNGTTQAGTYLAPETLNAAGRITAVVMEFKPKDGNTSLIQAGSVLKFVSGSDCSSATTATIIPDAGKCVSVFSNHGENTSGTVNIPDINSEPSKDIITYKTEIKISCKTPVCGIKSDSLAFIDQGVVASVNKREASAQTFDRNTTDEFGCYTDGCNNATSTTCTTYIAIQNNTEYNLTKLSLTPTFDGTFPTGMTAVVDANGTETKLVSGSAIVVDLAGAKNIAPDTNHTIKMVFSTDGKSIIPEGLVSGVVSNIETNGSTAVNDALKSATLTAKEGIAKFAKGTPSTFTVTYMNPNYKSFAMITATSADTILKATVTDTKGVVAKVEFADIKKGETAFVFADNKSSHGEYDLVQKVKDSGVTLNNGWRVDFEVTSAVDVAAYMEQNGGQRTLTVLYPEYTHGL